MYIILGVDVRLLLVIYGLLWATLRLLWSQLVSFRKSYHTAIRGPHNLLRGAKGPLPTWAHGLATAPKIMHVQA